MLSETLVTCAHLRHCDETHTEVIFPCVFMRTQPSRPRSVGVCHVCVRPARGARDRVGISDYGGLDSCFIAEATHTHVEAPFMSLLRLEMLCSWASFFAQILTKAGKREPLFRLIAALFWDLSKILNRTRPTSRSGLLIQSKYNFSLADVQAANRAL